MNAAQFVAKVVEIAKQQDRPVYQVDLWQENGKWQLRFWFR